jgi:hypothetical protein
MSIVFESTANSSPNDAVGAPLTWYAAFAPAGVVAKGWEMTRVPQVHAPATASRDSVSIVVRRMV